ncbi:efflux RND transporter periplasmic adaptor subunit [Paenibacillus soyae]|uniref:Efflux RND transporter periplasmic adaptor subunit n=1 Tax=Paenibacillus soyae TaxID=2969249 RepID=A0A9X2MYX3_9BACL|nr:efflux RND transporter periplasmic adaptor subunit [Paenibacillus soyae]MCR2806067.1 efflux RND transporter periplasmic adaptor subunit [Paenibacillus soyae]
MSFRAKNSAFAALAMSFMIALTGCTLLPAEEEPLKPPLVKPKQENYRTTAVVKGSIAQEVKGNGTLESYESDSISFKSEGGRVKEMLVRAGAEVKRGDVLVQLDVGDMDITLKQLEMNLLLSKAKVRDAKLAGDDEALRIAQLQQEIDGMKYERMLESVNGKQIVATMDGTVTFVAPLEEGNIVKPYETIVIISDPSKLRVSFQVSSTADASKVGVGFNASLKLGADEPIEGKVSQTPSSAPLTEDEMLRERYKSHVYVETDQLPATAKIGDRVDVTIRLQERDGALIIPKSGLRNYLGRTFVRVLEDGDKIREIDVEQGIVGSTEVEITKGVEEGQLIILQ